MALGLDLGSRTVKGVFFKAGRVAARFCADTVPFLSRAARGEGLDLAGAAWSPPQNAALFVTEPLIVTGYGRRALKNAAGVTEIRAHFKGALFQTGLQDFTLVEIGGQDSKAIQVKGGRVFDFQTNDKCAAGTGRYVENMARLLGVDLDRLAGAWAEPSRINNTCAIFGESEIIGQVVEGVPLEQIMAGVNDSIARRVVQMIKRYKPQRVVFCGGVALNRGVVKRLQEHLRVEVLVPPEPLFNGAIGCALETAEQAGSF